MLAITLLVSSCAVFVSKYDEPTDAAIQQIAKKTEVFIAEITATRGSYQTHKNFYIEIEGELKALEMRSNLFSKNGSSGKRVGSDRFEVEFAEVEEDGHAIVGEVAEASGSGFDGLDKRVKPLC